MDRVRLKKKKADAQSKAVAVVSSRPYKVGFRLNAKGCYVFAKGFSHSPGRPKGAQTKVTKMLRKAIIMAASNVGHMLVPGQRRRRDGLELYLEACAHQFPQDYMVLLARILPKVMTEPDEEKPDYQGPRPTLEALENKLRRLGVSYTGFDRAPMRVIEHEPATSGPIIR